MMKKCSVVLLLCTVILLVFALSACSNREREDNKLSLDRVKNCRKKGTNFRGKILRNLAAPI